MEVVYYHLTELGEVELQEMRSDYQTVIDINERIFNYKVSREVAK